MLFGLKHLDLSNNQLEVSIPDTLGNLKELTYLFLSDNEFLNEAPIPDWIHNLTTL
jgi:Leucine-rich repeat (LRR) protein